MATKFGLKNKIPLLPQKSFFFSIEIQPNFNGFLPEPRISDVGGHSLDCEHGCKPRLEPELEKPEWDIESEPGWKPGLELESEHGCEEGDLTVNLKWHLDGNQN